MRTYPRNSPQACARILALAMLADRSLCKQELDTGDRLDLHDRIGLEKDGFHAAVQTFGEDLLTAAWANCGDTCRVDPDSLAAWMTEIDIPDLRRKLIDLCVAIVEADGRVADTESIVLEAAVAHWGLQHEMLQTQGGMSEHAVPFALWGADPGCDWRERMAGHKRHAQHAACGVAGPMTAAAGWLPQ